ncbi:MAG: ABC transporter permease [Alphaproteobacteria bacterium]|nr:ABC transporter permease [Alphaproteobacteria bacterium]
MTIPRRVLWSAALKGAAGLAFAFMLLPLALVIWLAFFRGEIIVFPPEGYSLHWFASIWEKRQFVDGFVTSLQVGLFAMVGGLVLGIPASFALARTVFRGQEALNTLLLLPLVVPGIVIGTSLYIYFVEVEIATELQMNASLPGLALAHIMITIPWVVKLIVANLLGVKREIEEAAMTLGANRWRTLTRVTLPLIRPGVVAAALFSFVVSFSNLEISLFLVGPGRLTLPIAIMQYLEWKLDPSIAAVSVVQIAIVAAGMLITDRFVRLSQVV